MSDEPTEIDKALLLYVLRSSGDYGDEVFQYAREDRKLSAKTAKSLKTKFKKLCTDIGIPASTDIKEEDALKLAKVYKLVLKKEEIKKFRKNYDVTIEYVITEYQQIESNSESGSERGSENSGEDENEEEESDKEEDKTIQNLEDAMGNVQLDDKK